MINRSRPFSWLFVLVLVSCAESDREKWTDPATGMEFVLVPSGSFQMGSPHDERDREAQERQHEVEISRPFFAGRHEVTQSQWEKIMGENPSHFSECGPDCPVENISWQEAQDFLTRLTEQSGVHMRLPTEAEWEWICRSGTKSAFSTGDGLDSAEANFDGDPPLPGWPPGVDRKRTTPVASFKANPWGLYDLHGNVWEWTQDEHCPYPQGSVSDPLASCGSVHKVIRGGSWHFGPDSARCALRYTHRPEDVGPSLGLRVVRDDY